jgi:hypothetical protein
MEKEWNWTYLKAENSAVIVIQGVEDVVGVLACVG